MLLPFDTISRTGDFDDRAAIMHLRPWQWRFLLATDGRTRLDELARACGIEFETAVDLVHESVGLGLIEIVTQTLEDYRSTHASELEPIPFAALVKPVDTPIAAPVKKLSVSFDALNSMFADVAPVAPVERAAPLDDTPFAFETPDHMAPFVDRAPRERMPAESLPIAHDWPVEDDTSTDRMPSVSKSVSFSLFATNFGNAKAPLLHETEHTHDAHHEMVSNGHATMTDIAHEPVFEDRVVDVELPAREEVHHEESYASFDIVHDVVNEHAAMDAHVVLAPHEHVADHGPAIADVAEPALAKDDVLLQHYYVGANGAAPDPSLEDASAKTDGDLTSSLLRALGLKK